MRYLVKAKLKSGKKRPLIRAINNGSLGRGSIAGDEYLHNMREARVDKSGTAIWVETCFCEPPLAEERPYWEEYFELLSVKDAHSRRNCRHENGTELWACCDCDCTKKLEEKLPIQGTSFLNTFAVAEKQFLGACTASSSSRCQTQFVIQALSLVGSCFIASNSESKRSRTKHIYVS